MKKLLLPLISLFTAGSMMGADYVKVTTAPIDWTGEYVLVGQDKEGKNYAFSGEDIALGSTAVTLKGDTIINYDGAKINVISVESAYALKVIGGVNNGKFMSSGTSAPTYANALKFAEDSTKHQVKIELDGDLNVNLIQTTSSGDVSIRFNYASDQMRFRFYKSGQQPVQLYKKLDTVSDTTTTVLPDTSTIATTYTVNLTVNGMTEVDNLVAGADKNTETYAPAIVLKKGANSIEAGNYIFVTAWSDATNREVAVTIDGEAIELGAWGDWVSPSPLAANMDIVVNFSESAPEIEGDDYDMQEDVEYAYTTNELEKNKISQLSTGVKYAYIEMTDTKTAFSTYLFFDSTAESLPAGTYTVQDGYEAGNAMPCVVDEDGVLGTFFANLTATGNLGLPFYMAYSGTVTVSYDAVGNLNLEANLVNTWGKAGHFTMTTATTPIVVDTVEVVCNDFYGEEYDGVEYYLELAEAGSNISYCFDILYPEGKTALEPGVTYTLADMDPDYTNVYDYETEETIEDAISATYCYTLDEKGLMHIEATMGTKRHFYKLSYVQKPLPTFADTVRINIAEPHWVNAAADMGFWYITGYSADSTFYVSFSNGEDVEQVAGNYSLADMDPDYTAIYYFYEDGSRVALDLATASIKAEIVDTTYVFSVNATDVEGNNFVINFAPVPDPELIKADPNKIYTIAEAKAAQSAGVIKDNDTIMVQGYISNMFLKPTNFAKYGSVNIWLTDTKNGAEKEFELFNCYGLMGDTLATWGPNFVESGSSNLDVEYVIGRDNMKFSVGDLIVAKGAFKLYNTTYELNTGCYIVEGGEEVTGIASLADEKAQKNGKFLKSNVVTVVRNGKHFNLMGTQVQQ